MKLVIYFSGEENLGRPETVLGDDANVMFTFWNAFVRKGKPDKRFKQVYRARKYQQLEEPRRAESRQ